MPAATTTTVAFGANPSLPDHRDRVFQLPRAVPRKEVDLRAQGPLIWDQGNIGSCVPHGTLRAVNHAERRAGLRLISPSALFTYYTGRDLEGSSDRDSGMYVRDGPKTANSAGVADRFAWPYDTARYTERPPRAAYDGAAHVRALTYQRLTGVDDVHWHLQHGVPVIFGVTVYPSFVDAWFADGRVPMPAEGERPEGGHCMLIEGYQYFSDAFLVANSWGTGGGQAGYLLIPSAMFEPGNGYVFPDDLWTIETSQ